MDPGMVIGDSGRQELTVGGKTYIMDGGWMVDKEALAPYGYDPDAAPPEVVEANRVERAQLRNRAGRMKKQAAWRQNNAYAQQFSQQFGGAPYFAGTQGLRKARELGLNTEALVDDQGGDLALYLLNNQISLAQKPDGSWGFINTGQDPRDPNAQWVGANTGAGGVASGLNWEKSAPKPATPPATPPPPPTDPYDPNGKPIQIPGTSPAADVIGGSMGGPSAPPVMPPTPAPGTGIGIGGAKPPQTTRPPQPAGKPPVPSPTDPMTPTKPPVSMGAVGGPTPPQSAPPIAAPTNRYQNKLRPMGTLARQPQQRLRPGGF